MRFFLIALCMISIIGFSYAQTPHLSPLKQIQNGIDPLDVTCNDAFELVFKMTSQDPACVKLSSVSRLVEIGWAIHVLPNVDNSKPQNSKDMNFGDYETQKDSVRYNDSNGFLVKPVSDESFPGVILIHEWWGLNENIKETAEKLSSHGYVVLAIDLFDGNVATDAQTAMSLVSDFEQQDAIENMNHAVLFLQSNYNIESIGSIGWCFGGAQSLTLALNNDNMDATVIYYGRLVTEPDVLSAINWPVLGIFAQLDQGIPVSSVNEFQDALTILDIPNDIHIYPDVDHAFANPTGQRYSPIEANDAWQKTLTFFDDTLKS